MALFHEITNKAGRQTDKRAARRETGDIKNQNVAFHQRQKVQRVGMTLSIGSEISSCFTNVFSLFVVKMYDCFLRSVSEVRR